MSSHDEGDRPDVPTTTGGGSESVGGAEVGLLELEADLARLQTELNAADRASAAALGVGTAEDLQVLRFLLREGPLRVGVLARARGASTATVSARLDRLEKRGLLTRDRLPGDRRSVAATLTKAGRIAAAASLDERIEVLSSMSTAPPDGVLKPIINALSRPDASLPHTRRRTTT